MKLIGQVDEVLSVAAFKQGPGNLIQLLPVDEFHAVCDLFNATDFQSLAVLYHLNKLGCLQQRFKSPRIQSCNAAA